MAKMIRYYRRLALYLRYPSPTRRRMQMAPTEDIETRNSKRHQVWVMSRLMMAVMQPPQAQTPRFVLEVLRVGMNRCILQVVVLTRSKAYLNNIRPPLSKTLTTSRPAQPPTFSRNSSSCPSGPHSRQGHPSPCPSRRRRGSRLHNCKRSRSGGRQRLWTRESR